MSLLALILFQSVYLSAGTPPGTPQLMVSRVIINLTQSSCAGAWTELGKNKNKIGFMIISHVLHMTSRGVCFEIGETGKTLRGKRVNINKLSRAP